MTNSRFKFRVWDKEEKHMYYMPAAELYEELFLRADGALCLNVVNETGEMVEADNDRFELIQSTGLYDREGKEIWEGDLVQVQPFGEVTDDEKWLYEVRFIDGSFCGIGLEDGEDDEELLSDLSGLNCCKVIGNRFENSELLESKNGLQ